MSSDVQARSETPLASKFKERIRLKGPIPVFEYMQSCLQDPEHGYYIKAPAIGAEGDFITAPEISQVFGELIGLWCAVVSQQMGFPEKLNVVELGPGRGTLMHDALRAMRAVTGCFDTVQVHLVESSGCLAAQAHAKLETFDKKIHCHRTIADAVEQLEGATIVLGNEFLDAMPVEQFEFRSDGWRARCVSLSSTGDLDFALSKSVIPAPLGLPSTKPSEGSVFESHDFESLFADLLPALQHGHAQFAALFVDYGHTTSGYGDTLQGSYRHQTVGPFHAPGETDLTTQVDFEAFARAASSVHLSVDGPTTQGEFLGRLGIIERTSRLMSKNPSKASIVEAATARLIAPNGMGTRFKAIGLHSSGLPPLPGFA